MDEQCNICPYCRGIPGVGDSPVNDPKTPFDEVLYETPQIVLTPALGMLVPGCFLVISKKHVDSYACLNRRSLIVIEQHLEKIIKWLQPIFGKYLVFEHGALSSQSEAHGGCIIHAHFHLFPTAKETGSTVLSSFSWETITSLSGLSKAKDYSYVLLGLDNHYYLYKSPKLPSQWIRRVVVDSLDIPKHWDWGADFGEKELEITLAELNKYNQHINL